MLLDTWHFWFKRDSSLNNTKPLRSLNLWQGTYSPRCSMILFIDWFSSGVALGIFSEAGRLWVGGDRLVTGRGHLARGAFAYQGPKTNFSTVSFLETESWNPKETARKAKPLGFLLFGGKLKVLKGFEQVSLYPFCGSRGMKHSSFNQKPTRFFASQQKKLHVALLCAQAQGTPKS